MNSGNGSFTGRFLHPENGSVAPFSGVFLQDIDEAVGWFRGIDECGSLQMFETSPVTELP
jgi:hypothetical protein